MVLLLILITVIIITAKSRPRGKLETRNLIVRGPKLKDMMRKTKEKVTSDAECATGFSVTAMSIPINIAGMHLPNLCVKTKSLESVKVLPR